MTRVTLAERILTHLAQHPFDADAANVPREVTQDGIAEAVGARVAHVSRALQGLVANGLVHANLARVKGARRRSRAHALTDEGRKRAAELPPIDLSASNDERVERPSLVLRPQAVAALRAALAEASRAGPRCVLVEGDAGSGKTRLLDAFSADANADGARVVRGRGAPAAGEQLFGPLREALSPLGLDAAFAARAGGDHDRALAAAVDVLARASVARPVVLLLDEIHLAGAPAVRFLNGVLLGLPPGSRVLAVASFRREEAWELPNGPLYASLMPLRQPPLGSLVTLGPLDVEGVRALMREVGAPLDDDLVARVLRESGGNPLYVAAIADALLDGVDESDFSPAIVLDTLKERLVDLEDAPRAVLQLAAVADVEVDYDLLARAHDGGEPDLARQLDVLLDRLLLEEVTDGDKLHLRFEHPKVREAVLADLSATTRRVLSARVATARAGDA